MHFLFFYLAACSGLHYLFSGSCNRRFGGGEAIVETLLSRIYIYIYNIYIYIIGVWGGVFFFKCLVVIFHYHVRFNGSRHICIIL